MVPFRMWSLAWKVRTTHTDITPFQTAKENISDVWKRKLKLDLEHWNSNKNLLYMKVVFFLHFTKEPNRHREWRRLVGQVSGQNFWLHSCPWPLLPLRAHCHITSLWFQEFLRAGSGGGAGWTLSRYLGFTDKQRTGWWHIYSIGLLPKLAMSFLGSSQSLFLASGYWQCK